MSLTIKRNELQHLTILFVNDVYSFYPIDNEGGFLTLSTMLNDYYNPSNTLFFLTGDFLGGSYITEFCQGKSAIEIMNELPLDGVCIGNHEFDYGTEECIKRINESKFKWYGANVFHHNKLMNGLIPYDIIERTISINNHEKITLKIGILGIVTCKTPYLAYPSKETIFKDYNPIIKDILHKMTEEGVDFIIALTHIRMSEDIELARNFGDKIDVILGGHDHTPFQQIVNNTLIMKCGQNAEWLGKIDYEVVNMKSSLKVFNSQNNTNLSYKFFPTISLVKNRHYQINKKLLNIIKSYETLAHGNINHEEPICQIINGTLSTKTEISRFSCSIFGQIIAESMYDYFQHILHYNDIDGALINGGFIRGNKVYQEHQFLTLNDLLFIELPFPKESILMEILGSDLLQALEQMFHLSPASNAALPHCTSSIQIKVNFKENKHKIQSIQIHNENIQLDKTYKWWGWLF